MAQNKKTVAGTVSGSLKPSPEVSTPPQVVYFGAEMMALFNIPDTPTRREYDHEAELYRDIFELSNIVQKIEEHTGKRWTVRQKMLFFLLVKKLTVQTSHGKDVPAHALRVHLTLEEYMTWRGKLKAGMSKQQIADAKRDCRQAMKQDAAFLNKIKIHLPTLPKKLEYNTKNKPVQLTLQLDWALFGAKGVWSNGGLTMDFTLAAMELITNSYPMFFPDWLGMIDPRDSNLFNLAFKLCYHFSIDANRTIWRDSCGTERLKARISLAALAETLGEYRTVEHVMNHGTRSIRASIINPIKEKLEGLEDARWIWWQETAAKGEEITLSAFDAEKYDYTPTMRASEELQRTYIDFEIIDETIRQPLLERTKNHLAKQKAAKEKKKRATKRKKLPK